MATAKLRTNTKRRASAVRVSKKKKRGLSKLQALAIAGVLAIIGVVAVVASQASGTPNYQYSANKYCVEANGKSSQKAIIDCKNTSAEAMVYRMYNGLYGRNPDSGGYAFWTQKLAGDRVKITETSLVVDQTKKMGSDTAFVKALYTNMFKRTASQKEVDQWVARLKATGNKNWSRQKVAAQFAISTEAINKNQSAWDNYFARAPKVNVVQTAAQEQRQRYDKMFKEYRQPAERDKEDAQAALNTAKAQLTAAGKAADKNPPSAGDLNAIAANQAAAGNAYAIASSRATSAAAKAEAAKRLYDEAKELADYATDIRGNSVYGLKQIGDRYRATKGSATAAKSYAGSTKARVNDIAKKYIVAEKKYQDEQKRLAAIAAANANKGGGGNGGGNVPGPNAPANMDTIGRRVDCSSKQSRTESRKIDGGRTTQQRRSGWFSVGRTCREVWGPWTTTSTQNSTPKQCPNGFFPAKGYCWNGTVGKYVKLEADCPSGMSMYTTKLLGGLKYKECRTVKRYYSN